MKELQQEPIEEEEIESDDVSVSKKEESFTLNNSVKKSKKRKYVEFQGDNHESQSQTVSIKKLKIEEPQGSKYPDFLRIGGQTNESQKVSPDKELRFSMGQKSV